MDIYNPVVSADELCCNFYSWHVHQVDILLPLSLSPSSVCAVIGNTSPVLSSLSVWQFKVNIRYLAREERDKVDYPRWSYCYVSVPKAATIACIRKISCGNVLREGFPSVPVSESNNNSSVWMWCKAIGQGIPEESSRRRRRSSEEVCEGEGWSSESATVTNFQSDNVWPNTA